MTLLFSFSLLKPYSRVPINYSTDWYMGDEKYSDIICKGSNSNANSPKWARRSFLITMSKRRKMVRWP